MERKEEIILATLELASQKGLSNVSMEQIAQKIGIKKPSLYNHFKSKEELVEAMYTFLRNKSKEKSINSNLDYANLLKDKSAEEILKIAVKNYFDISTQSEMFAFYKIIYSERALNKNAAHIMVEETNKMINATKNIFYALQAHNKINFKDIDIAATSFALTIHSLIDYKLDCLNSESKFDNTLIDNYITWFCNQK